MKEKKSLYLLILPPSSFILAFQPLSPKKAEDMKRLPKIFALYTLACAMLVSPFSFVMAQNKLVTPPQPPMAKKTPKTTNIHGETLLDNYFWLREKKNPEVMAYLEAERDRKSVV